MPAPLCCYFTAAFWFCPPEAQHFYAISALTMHQHHAYLARVLRDLFSYGMDTLRPPTSAQLAALGEQTHCRTSFAKEKGNSFFTAVQRDRGPSQQLQAHCMANKLISSARGHSRCQWRMRQGGCSEGTAMLQLPLITGCSVYAELSSCLYFAGIV